MSCSISGAYSPEQIDTLARKLHAEVSGSGFNTSGLCPCAAADSGKGARVTPGEYYIEGDEQKQVSGINLQKGDTKAAEWMKRAEDEEK